MPHLYGLHAPYDDRPTCSSAGPFCGKSTSIPLFRCDDCSNPLLYCKDCFVGRHQYLPFHRVLEWTTQERFQRTSLFELGLELHLSHSGVRCRQEQEWLSLAIRHTNGVHRVRVRYCGCGKIEPHLQLVAARLFPVTTLKPRAAFSFDILEQFCSINLTSKISAYDFLNALAHLTDKSRPDEVQVCSFIHRQIL